MKLCLRLGAGLGALLPSLLPAAASGPATALAPYIVTATRVPQATEQLPVAVDVFSASELQGSPAATLDDALRAAKDDPRLVAVGEIGLDYFVPELDELTQAYYFEEQLKLAELFNLPVILHVRRSQDAILKALRRRNIPGGIAHAFNGSFQQAEQFIELGFKLGFGGAATYERALQIRRLIKELPLESIVTETDAPDIPPAWLKAENLTFNEPAFLPRIAKELAAIRGVSNSEFASAVWRSAMQALPRWSALCADNPTLNLAS